MKKSKITLFAIENVIIETKQQEWVHAALCVSIEIELKVDWGCKGV